MTEDEQVMVTARASANILSLYVLILDTIGIQDKASYRTKMSELLSETINMLPNSELGKGD